jgi:hypothetical protein
MTCLGATVLRKATYNLEGGCEWRCREGGPVYKARGVDVLIDWNLKGRGYFRDLGIDGWITLKCNLDKWFMNTHWIRFDVIRLVITISKGICWSLKAGNSWPNLRASERKFLRDDMNVCYS